MVVFVQTFLTLRRLEVCFKINIRSNNHTIVPNDEKFLSQNWIFFSSEKKLYRCSWAIVNLLLKIRALSC